MRLDALAVPAERDLPPGELLRLRNHLVSEARRGTRTSRLAAPAGIRLDSRSRLRLVDSGAGGDPKRRELDQRVARPRLAGPRQSRLRRRLRGRGVAVEDRRHANRSGFVPVSAHECGYGIRRMRRSGHPSARHRGARRRDERTWARPDLRIRAAGTGGLERRDSSSGRADAAGPGRRRAEGVRRGREVLLGVLERFADRSRDRARRKRPRDRAPRALMERQSDRRS